MAERQTRDGTMEVTTAPPDAEGVRLCRICGNSDPPDIARCTNCWSLFPEGELVVEAVARRFQQQERRLQRRRRLRRLLVLAASFVVVLGLLSWFTAQYFGIFTRIQGAPASTLSSIPGPGDWPMYQRDPAHRAVVAESQRVPEGRLKWKFETNWHLYTSPAVVDGVIYLTTGDARVLALDAADGEVIWEHGVTGPVFSSPAVAGHLLYFGLRDGRVLALDKRDGKQRWEFETGDSVISSPAVKDGVLYIAAGNGKLYALDALTGKERWAHDTRSWTGNSPAVFDDVVAIASYDERLHIIDIHTGKERMDFYVEAHARGAAAFGEKYVFYADKLGAIRAVDWTKRIYPFEKAAMRLRLQLFLWGMIGSPPTPKGSVWSLAVGGRIYSTPVIAGGAVYVAAVEGQVAAADEETGERLWQWDSDNAFVGSPSIVNDTLFIGSTDGVLYALDAGSGEHLWEFRTDGRIIATPVMADGVLYVASWDGGLYALE